MQELVLKVRAAQTRLEVQTGRSPTVVDLARDPDLDIETVLEGLEAMVAQQLRSLDVPMDAGDEDGHVTRHELVGRADDQLALVDSSNSLRAAVSELPESDRLVLQLRFDHHLTQRQIAARIGVSQMQVSRIPRRITDNLREPMGVGGANITRPARPRRRSGGLSEAV
jgi:RNA polymerase sigma-B factor